MLSVILPSVIMLNVVMLKVVMLSIILLSVITLSVILLSVVMLSVAAPDFIATFKAEVSVEEKTGIFSILFCFFHPKGLFENLNVCLYKRQNIF